MDSELRPESLTRRHEPEPAAAGEGARRRSHRLQCDKVLVLGREDLRVLIALEQFHADPVISSRDGECRALFRERKTIIETVVHRVRR